jgi:hypothetical protein
MNEVGLTAVDKLDCGDWIGVHVMGHAIDRSHSNEVHYLGPLLFGLVRNHFPVRKPYPVCEWVRNIVNFPYQFENRCGHR